MKKVYELNTWSVSKEAEKLNSVAVAAAKQYSGKKFTVSIGEWTIKTYLVFAESKEEAKSFAFNEFNNNWNSDDRIQNDKIKVREVTNCKKYQ